MKILSRRQLNRRSAIQTAIDLTFWGSRAWGSSKPPSFAAVEHLSGGRLMPLRKLMGWRLVVMAGSAVSVVMAVAGCHGKSAEEYLAAGDDALQHNQLATAEQDYNEAAKAS